MGKSVKSEVFTLLIAYNLRNYGWHNIGQQAIFTTSYKEIVDQLIMALFLCVDAM
jgi:hypothetical protein